MISVRLLSRYARLSCCEHQWLEGCYVVGCWAAVGFVGFWQYGATKWCCLYWYAVDSEAMHVGNVFISVFCAGTCALRLQGLDARTSRIEQMQRMIEKKFEIVFYSNLLFENNSTYYRFFRMIFLVSQRWFASMRKGHFSFEDSKAGMLGISRAPDT